MGDKNKPLSDALRRALLALDISPEEHKKDLFLRQTTTSRSSTAKPLTVRQLNARVLQHKATTRAEREAEAKRLAEAARPKVPDARVMFSQIVKCLGCGLSSESLAHPQIFLRLRSLQGGRFKPGDYIFVPEDSHAEYPGAKLPKIIEHHYIEVSTCQKCFTNAVRSFSGRSTESWELGATPLPSTPSEEESQSSMLNICSSAMEAEGKFGIQGSPIPLLREEDVNFPRRSNSDSTSSHESPPVLAVPIASLIEEIHEVVNLVSGMQKQGEGK